MDLNSLLQKFREYKARLEEAKVLDDEIEIMLSNNALDVLAKKIIELTENNDYVKATKQLEANKQTVIAEKETVIAQYEQKINGIDTQMEAYAQNSDEVKAYLEIKDFL